VQPASTNRGDGLYNPPMSRNAVNFLVDTLLLLVLLCVLLTTGVVRFIFPPGPQAADWRVWGYGYDAWSWGQFAAQAVMGVTVLLHLVLHWRWVCGFVASRYGRWHRKRISLNEANVTLYGVSLLIVVLVVLGGLLLAAEFSAHEAPGVACSRCTQREHAPGQACLRLSAKACHPAVVRQGQDREQERSPS